jgi:hypothetical protein
MSQPLSGERIQPKAMAIDNTRIHILNQKTDYRNWCRQVEVKLRGLGIWWALDLEEDEVRPRRTEEFVPERFRKEGETKGPPIERTREEWEMADNQAIGVILGSISSEHQTTVSSAPTSKEVWNTLKSIFTQGGRQQLWHHLESMEVAAEMQYPDIRSKYTRIKAIDHELSFIGKEGHNYRDSHLIRFLIKNLPPGYDVTLQLIDTHEEIELKTAFEMLQARETSLTSGKLKLESYLAKDSKKTRAQGRGRNRVEGRGGYHSQSDGRSPSRKPSEKVQCYHCRKMGHFAKQCPDKKESAKLAREMSAMEVDDRPEMPSHAMRATSNSGTNRNVWIADSGATKHMTWSKKGFISYSSYEGEIFAANGDMIDVIGKGDLQLELEDSSILLQDVLHAPELTANLLSLPTIAARGISSVIEHESIRFCKNGQQIAEAQRRGGVYVLVNGTPETALLGESPETSEQEKQGRERQERILWHRRLGHISDSVVNRIKRGEEESGVKQLVVKTSEDICEPCRMAKQQQTAKKMTSRQTKRVLELVHIDTWGPAPGPESIGKIYLLTITDDFSRKLWVTLLPSKGHAQRRFIEWKAQVEAETGGKLAGLRSDNAKEFIQLAETLKPYGVKFEPSVPYHPQLNGVAERANRTLFDQVRAMLSDGKLPDVFWAEAAITAAYLHNKMPHGPKKKAPDSIWHRESVSIAHLKAFGCIAYVWIPKEKRSKLELRAWKGLMIGYEGDSIYRIFNPSTKKIESATSVRFDETKFGLEEAMKATTIIRSRTQPQESPTVGRQIQPQPDSTPSKDMLNLSVYPPLKDNERIEGLIQDRDGPGEDQEDPMNTRDKEDQVRDESDDSREQNQDRDGPEEDQVDPETTETMEDRSFPRDVTPGVMLDSKNQPRRSTRQRKAPGRFEAALYADSKTPRSYREAVEDPDLGLDWLEAIQKELDALEAFKTWEEADLPEGRKPVSSRWVFAIKRASDGSVSRLKARLVARGFTQQHGVDYEETFAPTVRYDSLRLILSLAASKDLEVHQLDIENAYLAGKLEEEIYMTPPDGMDSRGKVYKLKKSLYGLKQSARVWNQHLTDFLINKGFRKLEQDHSVLMSGKGVEDPDGVIIPVYVDDMLIVSKRIEKINATKEMLEGEFKVKDLGEVRTILGTLVHRNREERKMTLSQKIYSRNVLERFGMLQSNPVSSPMDPGMLKNLDVPGNGLEGPTKERNQYQQAMGCLIYLAVCTRPDISFAVSRLSQYNQDPKDVHWKMLQHLFRYVRGTVDLSLEYSGEKGLVGYTDSDYGGDVVRRKSTGAYLFLFNGGPVSWASKKMKTVATSTMEAEYMAMAEAAKHGIWMNRLLISLGTERQRTGALILADNRAALDLSKNPEQHSRSKHIDIRHHFVREQVALGSVEFEQISTNDMLADGLTKPLPGPAVKEMIRRIGQVRELA